jgi:ATP-dependent Lon protease
VTIVTALVSALSKRRIKANVAMTGEVTLRGNVMVVGGIKEKVLAAIRHGITDIIIPAENEKDLEEIQPELKKKVTFHMVRHVEEVLQLALLDKPKAVSAGKTTAKKTRSTTRKSKAISL